MKLGMGTRLLIGANFLTGLTAINGLEPTADTIEKTTLESGGWREFAQGLKDGGEVSIEGFFEPGDTLGQVALYNAFLSGVETPFTILFPSAIGASWTFNGIVTGAPGTSANTEDGVPFAATIKVTGAPSLGLTASGGLTALALTAAGGALTPVFANGNYSYTFSGVTAVSVTITPTAAAHTIKLFVDGVYSQDIVSGSASAAIALALNVGKKLTLIVNEVGKTQKIYEVIVVKTA